MPGRAPDLPDAAVYTHPDYPIEQHCRVQIQTILRNHQIEHLSKDSIAKCVSLFKDHVRQHTSQHSLDEVKLAAAQRNALVLLTSTGTSAQMPGSIQTLVQAQSPALVHVVPPLTVPFLAVVNASQPSAAQHSTSAQDTGTPTEAPLDDEGFEDYYSDEEDERDRYYEKDDTDDEERQAVDSSGPTNGSESEERDYIIDNNKEPRDEELREVNGTGQETEAGQKEDERVLEAEIARWKRSISQAKQDIVRLTACLDMARAGQSAQEKLKERTGWWAWIWGRR